MGAEQQHDGGLSPEMIAAGAQVLEALGELVDGYFSDDHARDGRARAREVAAEVYRAMSEKPQPEVQQWLVDRLAEDMRSSAVRTMEVLGYTYEGGELWKPPLGPSAQPLLDELDRLRERAEAAEAMLPDVMFITGIAKLPAGYERTEINGRPAFRRLKGE